jgi:glycosyltransferase involved in cell wall biosynthesis
MKNMTSDPDHAEARLVTIAVFGYNQEKFIEEAVRAAFAQTYSPLEVLLSDDASCDATFDIMKRLADEYSGPHSVVLNRNAHNRGLAEHINAVASLAHGEILVLCAGDDVSLPDRVSRIVERFRDPHVRAVYSGYYEVDADGALLREMPVVPAERFYTSLPALARGGGGVGLGATYAYHRDCFMIPGPLPAEIICEDCILPFRAAVLGTIDIIREPLVRYRKNANSATSVLRFMEEDYRRAHHAKLVEDLQGFHSSGRISQSTYQRIRRDLDKGMRWLIRNSHVQGRPLFHRIAKAVHFSCTWPERLLGRPFRSTAEHRAETGH